MADPLVWREVGAAHRAQLVTLVQRSAELMRQLHAARSMGLPSWCIGAGAVRNLVWDHLHGRATATAVQDVDLVYFDASTLNIESDRQVQEALTGLCPGPLWEVTNQATVHHWYEARFGYPVPPLGSLLEGLATWPETATAVGVWLTEASEIEVIAPFGLEDLFQLRVRHNPARATLEMYRHRVRSKRFAQRWPMLVIEGA